MTSAVTNGNGTAATRSTDTQPVVQTAQWHPDGHGQSGHPGQKRGPQHRVGARADRRRRHEIILVDGELDRRDADHRPQLPPRHQGGAPRKASAKAARCGRASLAATGDIIVMMDADGSMAPQEIRHYLHFLTNGYDFVKGSRFIGGGGSLDITPFRRLGNRFLLTVFNTLYDADLTDLCYGFCAFHRRYLELLALSATGFEIEAEMTCAQCRPVCGSQRCQVSSCLDARANRTCMPFGTADGYWKPPCVAGACDVRAMCASSSTTSGPICSLRKRHPGRDRQPGFDDDGSAATHRPGDRPAESGGSLTLRLATGESFPGSGVPGRRRVAAAGRVGSPACRIWRRRPHDAESQGRRADPVS